MIDKKFSPLDVLSAESTSTKKGLRLFRRSHYVNLRKCLNRPETCSVVLNVVQILYGPGDGSKLLNNYCFIIS